MKPTSATTSVSSESHANVLLQGVQTLRTSESLIDCTLIAEEEEVPVHKVVMAACSDYFQSMFCGGMKESKQNTVELQGIKAVTLKSLVDFAYTGDLHLSLENVEDIASAAQYLQMADVVVLCSKFMKEHLTLENVVEIVKLAQSCSMNCLLTATQEFIFNNFESVSEEIFMLFSEEQLLHLLSSNSLNITSEFALFEKLIKCKMMIQEKTFQEALSKVRYPLMTREELSRVAFTEVMLSPSNQYLVQEALGYKSDVFKQPLKQTERTQVRSDKTSFIFTLNQLIVSLKTSEEDDFRGICSFRGLGPMAVVDNFLYVCSEPAGNHDDCSQCTSFHRYDPRYHVWHQLPSINVNTDGLLLIPNQEQIYAIGGIGGNPVQSYLLKKNRWHSRASLSYDTDDPSGVVHKNKIYVSGGTRRNHGASCSNLSCYNAVSDEWESKAPMIEARRGHHMAVINDKLYAFGGHPDSGFHTFGLGIKNCHVTVEYYMPEVNQWTLTAMQLNGVIKGLVINGKDVTTGRQIRKFDNYFAIIFETYDTESEQVIKTVEKDLPDVGNHIEDVSMMNDCLTFPRS